MSTNDHIWKSIELPMVYSIRDTVEKNTSKKLFNMLHVVGEQTMLSTKFDVSVSIEREINNVK